FAGPGHDDAAAALGEIFELGHGFAGPRPGRNNEYYSSFGVPSGQGFGIVASDDLQPHALVGGEQNAGSLGIGAQAGEFLRMVRDGSLGGKVHYSAQTGRSRG